MGRNCGRVPAYFPTGSLAVLPVRKRLQPNIRSHISWCAFHRLSRYTPYFPNHSMCVWMVNWSVHFLATRSHLEKRRARRPVCLSRWLYARETRSSGKHYANSMQALRLLQMDTYAREVRQRSDNTRNNEEGRGLVGQALWRHLSHRPACCFTV